MQFYIHKKIKFHFFLTDFLCFHTQRHTEAQTCSLISGFDCCPAEKLRIITPLKDTEAKEGQEVVLNCEVNQEGAKAKWLKNEETLFESSKYVMVQRDNVFSLRIRDAQKGDEANYSINLTNQRGEQAKSSGGLTVKGQWSTVTVCLSAK